MFIHVLQSNCHHKWYAPHIFQNANIQVAEAFVNLSDYLTAKIYIYSLGHLKYNHWIEVTFPELPAYSSIQLVQYSA